MFLGIALIAVVIGVLNNFFVSHYVFRWRTAMNEHYMAHWQYLRHIEGRPACAGGHHAFCLYTGEYGREFYQCHHDAHRLSAGVSHPVSACAGFTHRRTYPLRLVIAAIVWSLMGTGLLAVVGIKLPGLEFKNQRVEAAYRKELVYGEDDASRATPPTVRELFSAVRHNYFRLYFHYMYFNIARILYLQVDNVFGLFLLFPSIVAGTITLGLMTQITNVFGGARFVPVFD